MPRFFSPRVRWRDTSASSSGTNRSAASTRVTRAPIDRCSEAYSTPIAPPPSTSTESGRPGANSASSLVTTRRPSAARPGSIRGRDPVASTIPRRAATSPYPSTRTPRGPVNSALPATTSTFACAKCACTPRWLRDTMSSRVATSAGQSTDSRTAFTPHRSRASAMPSTSSAACSIALLGMQPRCRQVPPTLSRSARTTLSPSPAARSAVE